MITKKSTKDELQTELDVLLKEKCALDWRLLSLERQSIALTCEYNIVNSLIGDARNRLEKYAS